MPAESELSPSLNSILLATKWLAPTAAAAKPRLPSGEDIFRNIFLIFLWEWNYFFIDGFNSLAVAVLSFNYTHLLLSHTLRKSDTHVIIISVPLIEKEK